jgi:hypothetical protein
MTASNGLSTIRCWRSNSAEPRGGPVGQALGGCKRALERRVFYKGRLQRVSETRGVGRAPGLPGSQTRDRGDPRLWASCQSEGEPRNSGRFGALEWRDAEATASLRPPRSAVPRPGRHRLLSWSPALPKGALRTHVILETSLGLASRRYEGQGFRTTSFAVIGHELTGPRRFRFLFLKEQTHDLSNRCLACCSGLPVGR